MAAVEFDTALDAWGLACPMPIVKARQAISTLQPGQVLKVLATDRGSVKDFQGWVQTAKNLRLLAQETETAEGQDIYVHYVQKMA
ncbi:MAG TPA: sulfurtransferase TusA family protein [Alphaproteobacteria bacterium]|nr:sulfurtransferase TusA family protein [Alphaproteobacteria bacterium]